MAESGKVPRMLAVSTLNGKGNPLKKEFLEVICLIYFFNKRIVYYSTSG
jgi:hypothetical protein